MPARLLLTLVLAATAWTPCAAATVRIFAVGHKQRVADAVTYDTFRQKMTALMDAAHPNRTSHVQAGVDDVASHLAPVDPTAPARALVVFPEDAGLIAALIGTRGATSRDQTSAAGAIVTLLTTYPGQFAYYDAKYPGQPFVRTLVLALTDTLYRSFYETFRDLARAYGVHLAVSANIPAARRVEAAAEPALVALLRDPDEPARTYAYEAVSPFPYNTAMVFAPDGQILVPDGNGGTRRAPSETGGVLSGSTNKAYLTPIEQPPPGEVAGLSLAFGPVRDLEVLDTPVGRLAIVISKDAWMIDVNDRFAAKGANVILQPEAFSAWGYATAPWEPDIFKEGGFANLQKNAGFLVNVNASMTGNLFDITFDGQTAILGRKRKIDPGPLSAANAWIGQNPDTGFLALAPWIIPDPGIGNPQLGLGARRAQLATIGAPLLPASGIPCPGPLAVGSCENGYRESVVWADVELPDDDTIAPVDPVREAPPRFEPAVRVSGAESQPVTQHDPRVAVRGSRVYVVWHQEASGTRSSVFLAVSEDGGRSFAAPVPVSDNAPGSVTEMHPAVAVRGRRVVVVWQEFADGASDDRGRIRLARFDAGGTKQGTDVRVDDDDSSGKWLPAVAFVGSRPLVVWVDERDRGPEGEALEHIYAARGRGDARVFEPAVRVDTSAPVPLAGHLDNKWGPTLTVVHRTAYVAWADFQNYNWDIFLGRSDDGGRTFGPSVRVDDFPDLERLNERPAVAADRDGRVHVAWTDLRAREADTNVFYARSGDRGRSFTASRQLDDSKSGFDQDRDTPSNQWHPSMVLNQGQLFVAWQDNRLGNNDVFFSTSLNGGLSFAPAERVDDTGAGASSQTRPSLALGGAGSNRICYAAWEDDRNGNRDVYLARRPCGS